MPRKRVHGHKKNNSVFNPDILTPTQHCLLTWGIVLSGMEADVGYDYTSKEGEFKTKMLWNLHRKEILQEYKDKKDTNNPGGRPAGYWKYDVQEDIPHNERWAYLRDHNLLESWEIEAAKLFNQKIRTKHYDIE